MGNLAFIGSHKINGVSALHTDLMRKTVFHALNSVYPGRITNKTNGITFRRWLIECNPGLADIIRSILGERALDDYRGAQGPRCARGRSGHPGAGGRGAQELQGGARPHHRRSAQPARRSRRDVRRAGQADPRIQAPAAQHSRDGRALQRHPRQPDHRLRAPGQDLRRQGGGELHAGQAHHQARHRRRQGRQFRSDRARAVESRFPAELQRLPGRDHHARPPTSRSRSRPPAWRPPAPAT